MELTLAAVLSSGFNDSCDGRCRGAIRGGDTGMSMQEIVSRRESGGGGRAGEKLRAAVLSASLSDLGLYLGAPAAASPPPPAPAVAAAQWPWARPLAAILRVSGRSLEEAVWSPRAAAEVGLLWRLWREGTGGARGEERLGA